MIANFQHAKELYHDHMAEKITEYFSDFHRLLLAQDTVDSVLKIAAKTYKDEGEHTVQC